MYIYAFNKFSGIDRIFFLEDFSSLKINAWDLFSDNNSVFLCLWENIPFSELYSSKIYISSRCEIVEKKFFSDYQLHLLNYIISNCYTTYKVAIKLFLDWDDPVVLLSYKRRSKKTKYNKVLPEDNGFYNFSGIVEDWQQLIVVPDLWTAYNIIDDDVFSKSSLWHSWLSEKQKIGIYRGCKMGSIGTLISTSAWVFHDWRNLKNIVFIDPNKRYYKNQQDPRYNVNDVLENIRKFWWI